MANGCGGPAGFGVPPGIADATTPNPVFSLTPSATVDEGNNWINVSWGPLALSNPAVNPGAAGGDYGGGPLLANYSLSAAIDNIPVAQPHPVRISMATRGRNRANRQPPGPLIQARSSSARAAGGGPERDRRPVAFGNAGVGYPSAAHTLTLHNTGMAAGTGITLVFSSTVFSQPAGAAGGTCTATLAAGATCRSTWCLRSRAGSSTGTLTITAAWRSRAPRCPERNRCRGRDAPTLTSTTWTLAHARKCPGTGILGIWPACSTRLSRSADQYGQGPLTGIPTACSAGRRQRRNYARSRCFDLRAGRRRPVVGDVTLNPGDLHHSGGVQAADRAVAGPAGYDLGDRPAERRPRP